MNKAGIYCILGNDEFRVAMATKRVLDGMLPDGDDGMALETVDGRAGNSSEAIEAINAVLAGLQSPGLFSDTKIVHLRAAEFLYDSRVGKAKAVKDRVSELAGVIKAGLPDEVSLIISATKMDKRYALYKSLKGVAEFEEFSLPEKEYQIGEHIEDRLHEAAKESGLKFSPGAIRAFASRVDPDTRTIYSEVSKIRDYMGNETSVDEGAVLEIVSHSRDRVTWDFADAVCRRDAKEAISVLRQLIFQGEEPIALIIGLENRFRDLFVMRVAMDRGWAEVQARGRSGSVVWQQNPEADQWLSASGALDPRKRHPFQQFQLAKKAGAFPAKRIDRILQAVVGTHERFMRSSLPPVSLLESLVLRILVRSSARAAR